VPYHIRLGREYVAKLVIGVGDWKRAELFANMLDEVEASERGRFLVYTGKARGTRVTIIGHGIGAPSVAIALEELRSLGMELFVRIGSAGSLSDLRIGDVIVAFGSASYPGELYRHYFDDAHPPLAADPVLTLKIYDHLKKYGAILGYVVSHDVFYGEDEQFVEYWRRRNALAVEMECGIIMAVGLMRGFKTACVLVVSNRAGETSTPSNLDDKYALVFEEVVNALAEMV